MNKLDELKEKLLSKFYEDIKRDIDLIVSHIKNIKGKIIIEKKSPSILSLIDILENNVPMPKSYKLLEDGISLLYCPRELLLFLAKNIDPEIEEIEIPLEALDDKQFLERMGNIRVFNVCNNDLLDESHLRIFFEKTNISEVNMDRYLLNGLENVPGMISLLCDGCLLKGKYQGISINNRWMMETKNSGFYMFNADSIDQLSLLEEMIDERKIKEVNFLAVNCNVPKIKNLFSPEADYNLFFRFEDGKITELNINIADVSVGRKILLSLEKYLEKDTKITFATRNETLEEFKQIKAILKKHNSQIEYGDIYNTDVNGFTGMRATIDYYKSIINEFDLSPYEKLLYVYDLIKSFEYKENEESPDKPRNIPDIVREGDIVCVGYAIFLKQLLLELGFGAECISLIVYEDGDGYGHVRNLVYLKDDKYNIDGVYSLDATYDSKSENLSLVVDSDNNEHVSRNPSSEDIVIKKYDSTAKYSNFLIPYSEYADFYTNKDDLVYEDMPRFLQNVFSFDLLDDYDKEEADKAIKSLFGDEYDIKEVIRKIKNSRTIDEEKFRAALSVIKRCQGYSLDDAVDFVNDVIEIRKICRDNLACNKKHKIEENKL